MLPRIPILQHRGLFCLQFLPSMKEHYLNAPFPPPLKKENNKIKLSRIKITATDYNVTDESLNIIKYKI